MDRAGVYGGSSPPTCTYLIERFIMDKVKLMTNTIYARLCEDVDVFTSSHDVYSIEIIPTQSNIYGFLVYYTIKDD